MKPTILLLLACVTLIFASAQTAPKWNDLTQEQKMMKAKEFRADNQKYLKTTLGMTQTQLDDIDNVNLCYLSTIDRINRYGKDEATKDKVADAVWKARWAQLDAIMGVDKHKQYAEYIHGKLQKATVSK